MDDVERLVCDLEGIMGDTQQSQSIIQTPFDGITVKTEGNDFDATDLFGQFTSDQGTGLKDINLDDITDITSPGHDSSGLSNPPGSVGGMNQGSKYSDGKYSDNTPMPNTPMPHTPMPNTPMTCNIQNPPSVAQSTSSGGGDSNQGMKSTCSTNHQPAHGHMTAVHAQQAQQQAQAAAQMAAQAAHNAAQLQHQKLPLNASSQQIQVHQQAQHQAQQQAAVAAAAAAQTQAAAIYAQQQHEAQAQEASPYVGLWGKVRSVLEENIQLFQSIYGPQFPIQFVQIRSHFADIIEQQKWHLVNPDDPGAHDEVKAVEMVRNVLGAIQHRCESTEEVDQKLLFYNLGTYFQNVYGSNPLELVRLTKKVLAMEQMLVQQALAAQAQGGSQPAQALHAGTRHKEIQKGLENLGKYTIEVENMVTKLCRLHEYLMIAKSHLEVFQKMSDSNQMNKEQQAQWKGETQKHTDYETQVVQMMGVIAEKYGKF